MLSNFFSNSTKKDSTKHAQISISKSGGLNRTIGTINPAVPREEMEQEYKQVINMMQDQI